MFTGGVSPSTAVRTAQSNVNNTISSYNSRLGVG
jgi:hypothetical protein